MKRELLFMKKVAKMSVAEGMVALMDILGNADVKTVEKPKTKAKVDKPAVVEKKVGPTVIYEGNRAIEVDGKKVTTGPKKKGKTGARAGKDDAGKNLLRPVYVAAIEEFASEGAKKPVFQHSTEGMVVRLEEADYAVKITKSVTPKFDKVEVNIDASDVDFTTRGKAKNSAGAIAKKIYFSIISAQMEENLSILLDENEKAKSNFDFKIVNAKASGVVVQSSLGEYTIKISKKRDRVGFEAEKAVAFEK